MIDQLKRFGATFLGAVLTAGILSPIALFFVSRLVANAVGWVIFVSVFGVQYRGELRSLVARREESEPEPPRPLGAITADDVRDVFARTKGDSLSTLVETTEEMKLLLRADDLDSEHWRNAKRSAPAYEFVLAARKMKLEALVNKLDEPADSPNAVEPMTRFAYELVRDERLRRGEKTTQPEQPTRALFSLDLSRDLRMRHVYCIGRSGTGKTTLLKNLLLDNFARGDGCAFIDPHGDAAEELLGLVPPERIDDVTYFDPTSSTAPAFNLLALPYAAPKLTEDILSAFRLLFGTSVTSAPRLEHILRHAVLTLLADSEPHSIKDLQSILRRADYRAEIVGRASNEQLREFWEHEFPSMPKDATSPILNKLSALLMPTSDLERVLSSSSNAIDFPTILDRGGIFIANLAKGKLGDEPSRLLGALLATAIQQAALARADRPAADRRDFYFYVDEFQNYAVSSFATILSEARKYALALTLANQTLSQTSDLRDAIFGNVATLVAFQVSADDASRLGREMHTTRRYWRTPTDAGQLPIESLLTVVRDRLHEEVEHARSSARLVEEGVRGGHRSDAFGLEQQSLNAFSDRLERNIRTLQDPTLSIDLLREIATQKLEMRDNEPLLPYKFDLFEEHFPSPQDFLNLKPLNAYVRIERAENVSPLFVPFPPAPNSTTRDAILARQAERARPSSPPPKPHQSPAPPVEAIAAAPAVIETPNAPTPPEPPSRRDKYSF